MRSLEEDPEGVFSGIKVVKREISDKQNRPSWVGKIRSTPTIVLFRDGEEVQRLVTTGQDAAIDKLKQWIRENT